MKYLNYFLDNFIYTVTTNLNVILRYIYDKIIFECRLGNVLKKKTDTFLQKYTYFHCNEKNHKAAIYYSKWFYHRYSIDNASRKL